MMAGSCCDALSAGRRLRAKDRRVSAFVQALSPRLGELHLRKHDNNPYMYNGRWWEQTTWKAVGDMFYRVLIRYKVMAPDALRVFAYLTPFVPSFEPELHLYAFTNCLYDTRIFKPAGAASSPASCAGCFPPSATRWPCRSSWARPTSTAAASRWRSSC